MNENFEKCIDCFLEILGQWQGIKESDFLYLENKFSSFRKGKPLNLELLRELKSGRHFRFNKYWYFPRLKKSFGEKLQEQTKDLFKNNNNEEIIETLTNIFKNIEVVSIILRFADPENYGIMSTPTRHMIFFHTEQEGVLKTVKTFRNKFFQVLFENKSSSIAEYLGYLECLKEYKEQFRLKRIADVDMVLWAIYHKTYFANYECSRCENHEELSNILSITRREEEEEEIIEEIKEEVNLDKIFQENLTKTNILPANKIKYSTREPNPPENLFFYMEKIAKCPYVKEVRCVEYCRGKGIPRFNWRDNGKVSFEYFDRNNKGAQLIISPSEELTSKDIHKQFLYGLAIYYWMQKEIKEKIEGFNSLSNLLFHY